MTNKCFFVGLFFFFFLGAFHAAAYTCNDNDLKAYYESCIDKRIGSCEKKALMWDSKFKNVNYYAIISMFKATYFKEYKHSLIEVMCANSIGKKQYKVDHFLNEQFHIAFKSSTAKDYMAASVRGVTDNSI